MERTINTKFYTFSQNNSGGYFVRDEQHGVAEYMILEALSPDDAWNRLQAIGERVSDFWVFCSCCGERWSDSMDEDDATDEPSIYGFPVSEAQSLSSAFRDTAYVHYLDSRIEKIELSTAN